MMIRTAQENQPDIIARIGALVMWLLLIAAAAMSTLEPAHAQGAVPEVTIVAGADVEEGEDAIFTLSRTGDPATELTVDVAVSERLSGSRSETRLESPGRVSGNAPNSVTFAQGASSVTLTLPTVDDTLYHRDVLVTPRILERATYTSGAASSATVTVSENDALIAQARINAPDVVLEGENLVFSVGVAANGLGGDMTYRVTLEDGTAQTPSDFLNGLAHDLEFSASLTSTSGTAADRLIENPDGTKEFSNASGRLFFSTINDGVPERDETMVIRVEPVSTTGGLTALGATRTITIRDRKPSVTIAAASSLVTEGTDALFNLSRTESTAEALTVNVTISETASKLSGSLPATVTFDAGAGEATLALNTQGDSVVGEHSTVTVTISPDTDDPATYRPGDPDTASVTVLDDDETARGVIVAPTELTVAEGGSGEYWVALRTAPTDTVTLAIASDDSAAATVSPASLTFTTANWDTRQKVTVTGEVDTDTNDETVTLTHDVGGGDYASEGVTAPPVTVTVDDDDETPVPMVWGFLGSGGEEGNDATFRLRRSGATDAELEVNVSVSETGEFLAEDEERSRTVTFAPGASVAQLSIPTVDDEFGEPDGTITVQIENGDAYAIGNPDTVQSTVFDDDGISSEVLLSVSPEEVGEYDPASDVTVTATLNLGARTEPTNIVIAFGAATDSANRGADYEADTQLTLTIAPGQTSAAGTIAVTPIDDAYGEGDETISLTGSTADLQVIGTQVTITDNEVASSEVTLMVSSSAVGEDDPATAVTVTAALDEDPRSEPTSVVVAVGATSDSATEGTDFEAIDDLTITIAAGAASATATFTLTPNDDAYGEGEETISVTGSNADLQVIGTQVTIADDETPSGEVTLETTPGAVGESDAATMITITATLDEDPRPAPTNIALAVGGSGDTATEGTDYETIGDLAFTIPAGAPSATTTFTLTPTADTDNEGEEAISVTGTTPDLTVTATRVTIADDETATEITLEVSPSSVPENEGERAIELTVRLKGAVRSTATNVSIAIGDASDSASEGVDYGTVADLSVTIGAGAPSATATFRLSPTDDTYGEGDEQISVSATASGLTVTGTQLTIADDETASTVVTIDVSPTAVRESDATTTVTVTATLDEDPRAAATEVAVTVGDAADSATEGTDYETVDDFTVTIEAGSTSAAGMFSLTPSDDTEGEGAETISVTASTPGLTTTDAELTLIDEERATGAPAITVPNVFRVPAVLSVDLSPIMDSSGVANIAASASYQWKRVEASGMADETNIGTDASTYMLTDAEAGKKVKVEVSFEDDRGAAESATSEAFPGTGTIEARATCAAPTLSDDARLIGSGRTLTLGKFDVAGSVYYGYFGGSEGGALDDTTFNIGTNPYGIEGISVTQAGGVTVTLDADLDARDRKSLSVHLCDTTLHFKDASHVNESASYTWSGSGLDWSNHAERTIYLSRDSTSPTVTSASVDGETLVITFSEDLDDSPFLTNSTFTVRRMRTGGMEDTVPLAGVHPDIEGNTVTLTLAYAVAATDTVTVSYQRGPVENEFDLRDEFGNPVLAFRSQEVTNTSINTSATGAPAITVPNVFRVPAVLGADLSAIMDDDGVARIADNVTRYQWKRFSADATSFEADIGTGATYTLTSADVGKKIKVEVNFEDDTGYQEHAASEAFPTTGAIEARATCAAPTLSGGARLIGAGRTVTLGRSNLGGFLTYGYFGGSLGGALDDTTLNIGTNRYGIEGISVDQNGGVSVNLDAALGARDRQSLSVHLCDTTLHFNAATHSAESDTYSWSGSGLDWSNHAERTIYLSNDTSSLARAFISNVEQSASSAVNQTFAVAFTTGGNSTGYGLTSVDVNVSSNHTSGVTPRVEIFEDSAGAPGTPFATLINPATVAADAINTFNAPSNTILDPNTVYWLVVSNPGDATGQGFFVKVASGNTLDGPAAMGWSMGNVVFKADIRSPAWSIHDTVRLLFAVRGTVVAGGANAAPTAADNTVETVQDTAYTFTADDFSFADADAADTLASVKIATLPVVGALALDGTAVMADKVISKVDIDEGDLTFTPVPGATGDAHANFTFKVNDGRDDSANAYTMTINVTAVSCGMPSFGDRRNRWSGTVTVGTVTSGSTTLGHGFNSDTSQGELAATGFVIGRNDYTVDAALVYSGSANAGDLAFSLTGDHDNNLTTAERAALRLHVCDSTAIYDFSTADLSTGSAGYTWAESLDWSAETTRTLYLSLPANTAATGAPAITGTAQSGQDLAVDLTGIVDADGLTGDLSIQADNANPGGVEYTYQWLRVDPDGVSNEAQIAAAEAATYTLTDADLGKKVKVRVSFTDDLSSSEMFTTEAYPSSSTVTGAGANTAPTADDNTVTTGEDRAYTFMADDFGFADTDTGNTLASVKIVTVPAAGTLALDGTAVLADGVVTTAQIDADMLIFRPARDAHGAAYTTFTFKVNDGTDDSADAYTMTIDVTDAPAPVCAVPDFGTRRNFWTGTAEVDGFTFFGTIFHGYAAGNPTRPTPAGELDDRTFTIGSNDYTVNGAYVAFTLAFAGTLYFEVPAGQALTNRESAALRLHVCDMPYDFSSATNTLNISTWTGSLDWSPPVVTRTLYLSLPANNDATGEPAITGTAQGGQELTADASPIMDTDGLTGVDFTYQWLRVDADGTSDEEDITDATDATYTLTDDDLGKTIKVKVSFTDELSGVEERTSDAYPSSGTVRGDNNAPVFSPAMPEREIAENTAAGVDVGAAVTATDADAGDNLTYMLGGADMASFDFVGTTGQIRTKSGVSYDHEAKASYTVTVTASDGTLTTDASVTISVTDVDEPPSAPATPTISAVSGSTTSLSVSWAAPANAGKPAIDNYDVQYRAGSSGTWIDGSQNVTGTTTTVASLVADTSYQVQVRATNAEGDSGWSDPPGTGRTNAPGNNAPVFSPAMPEREIAENTAAGVDVGAAVTATDADAGDTLSYTLGGADMASFDFVGTTGQIRTKSGVSYDHEAKASYTVTVTASDGTSTTGASVTISVTDVDEPPSAPATPTVSAVSGSTTSLSVSWAAPANAGKPAIDNYDVQYRVSGATAWTDGPQNVTTTTANVTSLVADTLYEVQVRATNAEGDSGWSAPPVSGRTNAPPNTAPTSADGYVEADEGTDYTFVADDFGFADTDARDSLASVKIVTLPASGTGTLTLSGTTIGSGDLPQTVLAAEIDDLKYSPAANLYGTDVASFTFKVNDGTVDSDNAYTMNIDVKGEDDPATGKPGITGTAQVGQTLTATVGTIADLDGLPDPFISHSSTTIQWIQVDGATETDISGATNETYTLATADEGKKIKVKVSFEDEDGTAEGPLTSDAYPASATVTAASVTNNAPVFADDTTSRSFTETVGDAAVTLQGEVGDAVTATDADGDTLTYSLEGTDVAKFGIVSGSGQIRTDFNQKYDREAKASYSVTVKADDSNGGSDTIAVTITVDNAVEKPLAPAIPTVTATSGSTTSLDVSWMAPANTGRPAITGYKVEYRAGVSGNWINHAHTGAGTTATIATLTAATSYQVQVLAVNSDGDGPFSGPAAGTTGTNTPPTSADERVEADEDLDYTFSSDDFAFTDTDTGDSLVSVKIVTLPASGTGTLTLSGTTIGSGDLPKTVLAAEIGSLKYSPPANLYGTDVASFTFKVNDGTVDSDNAYTITIDVKGENDSATGAPTITGTAQVGETLTAVTTGIMDADGLTSPTYTYQWIRANGTEADIASANSSTYILVAADLGKTIKVKVSFEDDDSNAETLTSAATATVVAAPMVTDVDVTSTPAALTDTYGTGEMIQFTVTFDQSVTVTGTPEFEFCLGTTSTMSCDAGTTPPARRRAALSSGTGTTALVFGYTVVVGDVDDDGIWIGDQSRTIKLETGDTIQGTVGGLDAVLTHEEKGALSGHKVNGAAANTPPTAANNTVTTAEDRAYTFEADDFGFMDADAGAALASVKIVTVPAAGILALDGTAVMALDDVTKAQIDGDMLAFTPARDAHGDAYTTFTFKVNDGTDDSASAYTMTIDVTDAPAPVCTAPDIAGDGRRQIWTSTVTVEAVTQLGDTPAYLFFETESVGELALKEFDIGSNNYTIDSIGVFTSGGGLFFGLDGSAPTLTATETAALRLHVCDVDYDFSTAISAVDNEVTFHWTTANLDWSPPVVTRTVYLSLPANNPATGEPAITGTAQAGQELTADASPIMDTDGLPSSFTYKWFRVDSDGTSNEAEISGETDATYTLTDDDEGKKIKVQVSFTDNLSGVEMRTSAAYPSSGTVIAASTTNTPPTAANNTVTTGEDRAYTFTAADFGFMDADAGDTLASVKIVTPPAAGTLALDGTAVLADGGVTKAQIDADMLTFRPAQDADGDAYTTFTFKVNDGTDDSADAYTMTIDVTDAPAPVCTAPSFGDRREIWSGEVTVERIEHLLSVFYGFSEVRSAGTLLPSQSFSIGSNSYSIDGIVVTTSVSLAFSLDEFDQLTDIENAALRLHVCDVDYDFNTSSGVSDRTDTIWPTTLDWSHPVVTRTLYLSLPANNVATGEPTITGTAQVGSTLTADASPIVDTDGLTDVDFTYQWIRVDADGTSNEEDISGEIAATYTLTDDDEGKKVKVKVSFTDELSGVEMRTSAAYPSSGTVTAAASTNTAPVFSSSNVSREIAENTAAGQNVGAAVTATDADAGDTLGYTLGGTDAASFDFVETTGQIRTKTNVSYDFEAKSSYTVTVTATDNSNATAVATVTIGVTDVDEPPSAPATPAVSAVSGSTTSLSVSWAAPANAGKPAIASYDVQYRAGTSGSWTDGPEDVATTTATITSLTADTLYQARVRATNAEGDSGWSAPPGSGRTNSLTNNAPVFSSSNTSRSIAENTAAGQNVGAPVTATDADAGDTLSYTLGGADAGSFDFVETTGQIRTKTNVSYDFEAKSSYTVTVTASDGTATTDASVTISITDVDEPPSAPATPAVSAVSGSTTRLTVSWAAPANAGKPAIANYDVQYRLGSSGAWTDGPQDVTGTTTTITSLATDTAYQARVRATNAEGDSGWSSPPGSGRTNAPSTSAPGAPRDLGTAPGDGRVTLAWTAPGSDGGAAIEKYRYRVSANAGSSWDPAWTDVPDGADAGDSAADETTFTVSGLINGTEYVFELRAVNSVGEGPAASATDTPVRAPLPPGSGFLVGNFGQPADRVASIFVTQDIVGVFTTGARGAELHNIEFRFFTRLPNITVLPIPSVTLYRASVTDSRATRGARVAALTAVPGTPRSTDTAQTVAFAAPSGTRLDAGTTYLVVLERAFPVSVESTTFPAEDAGGAPGWAIDGIGAGNNSPYSYRTTASLLMRVNGAAAGATVATAPEAPASLGARAGDAEVTLRWAPPRSDGGAGIEKYQVRYSAGSRVDPETGWTDVRDGSDPGMSLADERSVSVTGLDNGRQYAFELRAVNGVRAGAAATARATPAAPPRSGFLVSNFGQPVDGAAQIYVTKDIVGVFTTGALGATLDSIELRLFTRRPNIAVLPIPSVTLYRGSVTDTRATSGTRVATLTAAPGSPRPANTAQTVAFAAPSGTRLDAGATYLVVLEHTSYVRVESTHSSAQDAGGASGWTIDGVGAGNSSPYSYGTSDSLLMSVNGTTARAQRAVREAAVRKKAAKDEQQEEEQVQEPATSPDPDRGISLSTSSSSAIEGEAATISVRRAGPPDRATTVAVQVLDSALTGAWPIDVELRSGEATATATVPIPFDGARPASRTVTVRLASAEEPYSVGSPSTLTFNVTDRDAALSVDDASVSEGPGATLAFAVTLDRTRDREVRVKYATSDGTATQGDDYTGVSGTLRFAPGETTKTVSVTVLDDAHDEGTETLTLRLSSARRAVIDDATAVGTIVNSDPMPDAWLSRFGRAASDQVVQSIGRRLEGGARETHLTVMGWRMDTLLESTHSERDGREPRADAPGRQANGSVRAPDGRIGAAGAMTGATRGFGAMSGPGAARPAFDGAMTQGFPPMQGGTLQSPARAMGGLPANAGGNPGAPGGLRGAPGVVPVAVHAPGAVHAPAARGRGGPWANMLQGLLMKVGAGGDVRAPGLRDMVMGSSFYYGYSPDAGLLRGMNRLTAWGESASTRFSGAEGKLSLDGEVNTAILGADGEWGRWLAGLALSYSEGEGGYRQASAKGGAVSSTLTGVNPYARYRLDERTSLWATLGYGSGRLTLTPDGAESALETDMTNAMAAFGGRGVLSMRAGESGQFELALRSDAMLTDTASMAVAGLSAGEGATSRIRLILEGTGSLPAFGGVLAPKVEAGLRYDGGDAETGAGLEVGGGLAYDKDRLTVQVDGRVLLTHRDRDYEEWGYSLSFVYQPGEDGRGLRYRAGSQWGATQSGVQSLWSLQNAGGLASGAPTADGQRYTAELGYGFGVGRLWYPYVATESGGASSQALRFGLNLNAGSDLEAGLEIGRRAHLSCQMENDIRLQWQARW